MDMSMNFAICAWWRTHVRDRQMD